MIAKVYQMMGWYMTSFLERYCNGECEQVWEELHARGEQIRKEPLLSDTLAVARETMQRVRSNIEMLSVRLVDLGYQFKNPDAIIIPPAESTRLQIPLSLRAWYEIVGSVDFTGTHPTYPEIFDLAPLPDPLVINSVEYPLRECRRWRERYNRNDPFWDKLLSLPIAPDEYQKADIETDMAYEIIVPNSSADALLLNSWHRTTFVGYLRISLRWGGFAGFEDPNTRPTQIEKIMSELTRDILPI